MNGGTENPKPPELEGLGGVLSGEQIQEFSTGPERHRLVHPLHETFVRGARYDVRVAQDGMRTPAGEYIPLNGKAYPSRSLVLHSGESAWLSTVEQFALPWYIAGTVTLRAKYAARGLLLLSGNLIDPLYGTGEAGGDRRLHFFLVNLGVDPVELDLGPRGEDPFASVQFLVLATAKPPRKREIPELEQYDQPAELGFVRGLKELQDTHEALTIDVERTRDLTRNLIVVGYFLLGSTVLSATLATILTIASNRKLVDAINTAIPDQSGGKLLLGTVIVSAAWVVFSVALVVSPRRSPVSVVPAVPRGRRDAALGLVRRRVRLQILAVLLLGGWLASVAVYADQNGVFNDPPFWPLWIGVAAVVLAGLAIVIYDLGKPLTEKEIARERDRLVTEPSLRSIRGPKYAWRSLRDRFRRGDVEPAKDSPKDPPSSK